MHSSFPVRCTMPCAAVLGFPGLANFFIRTFKHVSVNEDDTTHDEEGVSFYYTTLPTTRAAVCFDLALITIFRFNALFRSAKGPVWYLYLIGCEGESMDRRYSLAAPDRSVKYLERNAVLKCITPKCIN